MKITVRACKTGRYELQLTDEVYINLSVKDLSAADLLNLKSQIITQLNGI